MALVALFPPWRQTYRGRPLIYNEEMGRHFVLSPPKPTGEQSWLIQAPAAECQVVVRRGTLLWQLGTAAGLAAILFAFLRGWPGPWPHPVRRAGVASLLLALCLPVPPLDGLPLAVWVGMAFASPFLDSGHLGPWFAPMTAAGGLAVYGIPIFLALAGIVWFAHRRAVAVAK